MDFDYADTAVYAKEFGWTLIMQYVDFVYELCIYVGLCGICKFTRGLPY